jgi:hypothetical protein
MGAVKLPVPVCGSGEKAAPTPCRAPPPWGSEVTWLELPDLLLIVLPPALQNSAPQNPTHSQQRSERKTDSCSNSFL